MGSESLFRLGSQGEKSGVSSLPSGFPPAFIIQHLQSAHVVGVSNEVFDYFLLS